MSMLTKFGLMIEQLGYKICWMAFPNYECKCDGIIGSSCHCKINDINTANKMQRFIFEFGSKIAGLGHKIFWKFENDEDKKMKLRYKILLKVGQYLHDIGLKISVFGSKMCDKIPAAYRPYDPSRPEYPVGPPIMDDAIKENLEELLVGRKDFQQFSTQIKEDECNIPPIKRGGCEVQTGCFRRYGCEEDK